jgi:hypothetical protein
MGRSRGPAGSMRYECDGCDARASVPEGQAPAGWLVEFARDLCPACRPAPVEPTGLVDVRFASGNVERFRWCPAARVELLALAKREGEAAPEITEVRA